MRAQDAHWNLIDLQHRNYVTDFMAAIFGTNLRHTSCLNITNHDQLE